VLPTRAKRTFCAALKMRTLIKRSNNDVRYYVGAWGISGLASSALLRAEFDRAASPPLGVDWTQRGLVSRLFNSQLAVALQQRAAATAQPSRVAAEAAEHGHVALAEHRLAQPNRITATDVLALLPAALLLGIPGLPIAGLAIAIAGLCRPVAHAMMGGVLGARPFVGMTRVRRRHRGQRNEDGQTQQRGLEHDEPFVN